MLLLFNYTFKMKAKRREYSETKPSLINKLTKRVELMWNGMEKFFHLLDYSNTIQSNKP